jgi:hypothetical protein
MISSCVRGPWLLLLCLFAVCLPCASQTGSPDVSLTGSLSARAVREDEAVEFILTIKNKADAKILPNVSLQNVTLLELPGGYRLATDRDKQVCVLPLVAPHAQECQTADDFQHSGMQIAASVAPGQSVTVRGFLTPNSPHKPALLATIVGWSTSGQSSSQVVSLGENQVQKTSQTALTWLSELIKLLAIPVVLALIGWGLSQLNRQHDERIAESNRQHDELVAAKQAERQRVEHDHEVEQAVRSETWKQMLLLSHNYAAKCYLPLSLAATRLSINLRALGTPQGDERIAFYYVLLCGREMTHTRKETGGLYFKDLRGETLAAECWRLQRNALLGSSEEDPFNLAIRDAIDGIADVDTYAAFKRKFEVAGAPTVAFNHPDMENAWTLFKNWRTTKSKAAAEVADYMEGFFAILDYEANRPYQYWYDTEPRLIVSDDTEKILRRILEEQKYAGKDIDDYFANVARPN